MTTGIVIMVVVVIVALVAVGVLWDSWRSGRAFCTPIPRPFRNRDSQEAVWRDRCSEGLGDADTVLTMLCEAFGFNLDDRYKFGPDDQVMRAVYEMVSLNESLIPVVEDDKVIGVLRSVDVFHELGLLLE